MVFRSSSCSSRAAWLIPSKGISNNLSILIILFLSVIAVFGQSDGPRAAKSFGDLVKTKSQHSGFTMITPSEAAASGVFERPLGDPCSTALRIEFEQQFDGALSSTDCRLDDGSYADFYFFDGLAGETAHIVMGSGVFISYVGVATTSGTVLDEDVYSIDVVLPESGSYIILANSLEPAQFGAYTIRLSGGPNCTFTFNPTSANVPASAGSYSFELTTQPRCYWRATGSTEVTTSSSGLGSGTVNYSVTANNVNQERYLSVGIRSAVSFYIRQEPRPCSYSLNPTSISVGPGQTSGVITVSGQSGCFWSASAPSSFISASGSGNGSGTASYTISNNNGSDRTGTIVIGGQNVPVMQAGRNCTYSVTPNSQVNVPSGGSQGNYVINTQAGCTWGITRNQFWIEVQGMASNTTFLNGSGPMTLPYRVLPNPEPSTRTAAIQFFYGLNDQSLSFSTYFDQAAQPRHAFSDFDGDGKADVSVYRPSNGLWFASRSGGGGDQIIQLGNSTDKIAPADYDGDGKTDLAVYRQSQGTWYIYNSATSTYTVTQFGLAEDLPVPGDYDADGMADIAVFRPSTGTWFIQGTYSGLKIDQFGRSGDIPAPGDYDGDFKNDLVVWRPSNGVWYERRSRLGDVGIQYGTSTDKIAQADYNGDGWTDICVYRPSQGTWYPYSIMTGTLPVVVFGNSTDIPVPADYDGDNRADVAVYRPSSGQWWLNRTTSGLTVLQYGLSSDKPVASAFGN